MLTDNCEIQFKTWYNREFDNRNLPYINGFEISDLSIRYGVYVEFFDSNDIFIDSNCINQDQYTNQIWNKTEKKPLFNGSIFNTRKEAYEQSIIKANEIYNNGKR